MYGEPGWNQKGMTWDALRSLRSSTNIPWLVLGDFNEILYNCEKEGGRPRTQRHLRAFHDALVDCQLVDMGYEGDIYTWQRGKIRERLDRGVVNNQWSNMFPHARLVNCEVLGLDHRPIMVDTEFLTQSYGDSKVRRFEARWLQEETVEAMVKAAWA